MLSGDNHSVDALGGEAVILDGHLRLAVRPEIRQNIALSGGRELHSQLVRKSDGKGHKLICLITGKAEHKALIARTAGVNTHSDIGGLFVDGGHHAAGLIIEAVFSTGVAYFFYCFTNYVGNIYVGFGGNFPCDNSHSGGDHCFAGNPAHRVVFEHCIKNRIGYLIGNLIRMPLSDGFRGKIVVFLIH